MVYSPERKQLIDAVEQNDLQALKVLVEKKKVPLSPPVAQIAAEKGFTKILEYVAKKRPSVLDCKDMYGNTILHLGVGAGGMSLKMLKFLVEEKDVTLLKTNDQRQTVARLAAKNGYLDIVEYIAETKPITLTKCDATGKGVLHMDDENKVMSLIEFLERKYGDDIPYWHRYEFEGEAVHAAVQQGHRKVLKYLLEKKGCDVDITNVDDETPVFSAIKYGRADIFKYLVEERNASLTLVNENEENVLFLIVNRKDLSTMKYVLDERKAELDVNSRNVVGNTLLHEAVINNQTDIVEYLVEQKHADVNLAASGLMTPLHYAAARTDHDLCKYLVEHGADARAKDDEGYYPKSYDGDSHLDSYLRDARKARERRSIVELSNESMIDRTAAIAPAYRGDERVQFRRGNVNGGEERGYQGHATTSVGGVTYSQLPSFLLFLELILFRGWGLSVHRRSGGRFPFLSQPTRMLDRIDPVAIDVVDSAHRYRY